MTARTLMVVGTMSSVGKSLLVTGLCRLFARRGVRVAPFKAQNLSNNAAVCVDGTEIGRAQALQALACGIEPSVDMNPVLIKPEAEGGAQLVLMGRPWRADPGIRFADRKAALWEAVTGALDRLCDSYDLVLIEGAGSVAELNLKPADIVNLAIARYVAAPTLLVGDIERGGIFAQLLGTLDLLEPDERSLIRGLVVNKFHGDPALFADGVRILAERSGLPVLGVIPAWPDLNLPDEDSASLDASAGSPAAAPIDIVAPLLPHIANFDDLDALRLEPGVRVRFVRSAADFGAPTAVIVPGSKSTIADLTWLRNTGLADAVLAFAQAGGAVVGICGGYQMLGERIADPDHVESSLDEVVALGLLPATTTFHNDKATARIRASVPSGPGWMAALYGSRVEGYEIHMGATVGARPWLRIEERNGADCEISDGGATADGRIWGCYLHGIFNNDALRHAWLASLGWRKPSHAGDYAAALEQSLDALADSLESALDLRQVERLIWG